MAEGALRDKRPSRVLTVFAVGFLGLDGVLLVLAGLWSSRAVLTGLGIACCLAAIAVVWYWQRYQRQLGDLHRAMAAREAALQAMHREIDRAQNR